MVNKETIRSLKSLEAEIVLLTGVRTELIKDILTGEVLGCNSTD
jgi:hypothetical protein